MTESTTTKIVELTSTNETKTVENDADASRIAQLEAKASLRKLMVSCIDSALEELGPIADVSEAIKKNQALGLSSAGIAPKPSSPTKEDLYGYGPSSPAPKKEDLYGYGPSSPAPVTSPAVELRGRMRRPRYQRRNSVTKFSLGNALKQVQQEDVEGNSLNKQQPQLSHRDRMMMLHKRMPMGRTADTTSNHLWQHLYSKLGEPSTPMKRPALAFPVDSSAALGSVVEMPATKRRRGSAA